MLYKISIELHPADGTLWRYDSFSDGPIGPWLESIGARLGKDMNGLSHNATIQVWERKT